MILYKNISQLMTLDCAHQKDGRNLLPQDLSILNNAAMIVKDEKVFWVGLQSDIPKEDFSKVIDIENRVITPSLADSHTHLVFGGDRSSEYTMRLNGADYQEIANAGGGILNTMNSTISSSKESLKKEAIERIERIKSYGVKSIEIKSGYALTFEKEKEISEIINELKAHFQGKVNIHNTFLAAHAVPSDFESSSLYIDEVCIPLLTTLAKSKLIDSVDIFHEQGYFTKDDVKKLFDKANELSVPTRIHADEFNDNKGAIIASTYESLSADHLLCTRADGIEALSKSNTVATVLPGTAFFLGKPLADAKSMLDAGCKVAIASDYNPGSSHCDNLMLVASIAAKNMNFNIAQLWAAITLNPSHSMNLKEQGALIPGMKALFNVYNCESIDQITYSWGRNLIDTNF